MNGDWNGEPDLNAEDYEEEIEERSNEEENL